MDRQTYYYFSIIIIIFIIFQTYVQWIQNEILIEGMWGKFHGLFTNIWNFYDLCLSQEGNYVNISIRGLLWFLVLLFIIYYPFLLVLLNFMTANQLSETRNQNIDTVQDLIEMKTSSSLYNPVILKQFEILDLMKVANEESKLRIVYNMIKNKPESQIILNMQDRTSLTAFGYNFINNLTEFKNVLIERSNLFQHVRFLACSIDIFSKFASSIHSSEIVSTGIQTIMMNDKLDSKVKRFIDYKFRTLNEFYLMHQLIHHDAHTIGSSISKGWSTTKGIICECTPDDTNLISDSIINPVKIESYVDTFQCCMVMLVCAIHSLVFEQIINRTLLFIRNRARMRA